MSQYSLPLSETEEQRARSLHEDAVVLDGVIPTGVYVKDRTYFEHLLDGGLTAANVTVSHFNHDFVQSVREIMTYQDHARRRDDLHIARSVADVRDAHAAGDVACILGFQDTRPLQKEIEFLDAFHQLGVRVIQLTYNSQNDVGSGAGARSDCGLSYFGERVVERMNDLGIVVDLSHCADATLLDAVDRSDDPVVCTHTGVRSICPARRLCKTDRQIEAVADTGGVIGITFYPTLVKRNPDTHDVVEATLDDVLDHVDHVVDLVGVDHVGFGSDLNDEAFENERSPVGDYQDRRLQTMRTDNPDVFGRDPGTFHRPPAGLERHSELPNLTRGLVARGYDDDEIRKILGENFLRVFEQVW